MTKKQYFLTIINVGVLEAFESVFDEKYYFFGIRSNKIAGEGEKRGA